MTDKSIFACASKTNVKKDKNKTNNNNKQVVSPIKIKNSRITSTPFISNNSNDVFYPSTNHSTDDCFQFSKTKGKCDRISSLNSPTHSHNKKLPIFILTNSFQPLAAIETLQNTNSISAKNYKNTSDNPLSDMGVSENPAPTIEKPPPIFVRGIQDIIGLSTELAKWIVSNNYFFNASLNSVKIQTALELL